MVVIIIIITKIIAEDNKNIVEEHNFLMKGIIPDDTCMGDIASFFINGYIRNPK